MSQNIKNKLWLKAKVVEGKKIGRVLNFPTINLDNPKLLKGKTEGVYATQVKIADKIYNGLLYFGPRLILGEKDNILEIYLLNFAKEIYGETIFFRILKFIRTVRYFAETKSFQIQLEEDVNVAKKYFSNSLL